MKKNEVPQDNETSIYGDKFGDGLLKYATDGEEYTTVQSVGWEPEIVALQQAWEEVELKILEAENDVKSGKTSPIPFYMEKKLLDISILSSYMNKWQWQVRRHFKPVVFINLGVTTLKNYADVFGITVEELKDIDLYKSNHNLEKKL